MRQILKLQNKWLGVRVWEVVKSADFRKILLDLGLQIGLGSGLGLSRKKYFLKGKDIA